MVSSLIPELALIFPTVPDDSANILSWWFPAWMQLTAMWFSDFCDVGNINQSFFLSKMLITIEVETSNSTISQFRRKFTPFYPAPSYRFSRMMFCLATCGCFSQFDQLCWIISDLTNHLQLVLSYSPSTVTKCQTFKVSSFFPHRKVVFLPFEGFSHIW